YGVRVPATAVDAQPTGHVMLARSLVPIPTSSTDWELTALTQTEVEIGCTYNDGLCHADATCVSVGTTGRGRCEPTAGTGDCSPACPNNQVCVDQVCMPRRTLSDLMD